MRAIKCVCAATATTGMRFLPLSYHIQLMIIFDIELMKIKSDYFPYLFRIFSSFSFANAFCCCCCSCSDAPSIWWCSIELLQNGNDGAMFVVASLLHAYCQSPPNMIVVASSCRSCGDRLLRSLLAYSRSPAQWVWRANEGQKNIKPNRGIYWFVLCPHFVWFFQTPRSLSFAVEESPVDVFLSS